jgi:hypothetical protein
MITIHIVRFIVNCSLRVACLPAGRPPSLNHGRPALAGRVEFRGASTGAAVAGKRYTGVKTVPVIFERDAKKTQPSERDLSQAGNGKTSRPRPAGRTIPIRVRVTGIGKVDDGRSASIPAGRPVASHAGGLPRTPLHFTGRYG